MANTIANVYVETFEQNLRHVAQQETVKLKPWVQVRGEESENHNWEKLGSSDAALKTTRLQATPVADTPWARRVAVSGTWDNGESTEQEDPVQMLVDPNSNLVMSLGYSMRRAQDDVIITAATADALEGDGTTTAFTAGQTVGDYTTPISFDAVTAVQEIFMDNDIDPSIPKVAVVGPTQVRKLMQLTEQTSSDYVAEKALQTLSSTGIVIGWMGFDWIVSNRLLQDVAGVDTHCFAFTRRGLGLAVNQDTFTRIGEDPSHSYMIQVFSQWTLGAVRVEDEHVVELHVAN